MISKDLREKIKLPLKKQIIYYPDRHKLNFEEVYEIEIVNFYNSGSAELCIKTNTNRQLFIHSDLLVHMQKPHFINDIYEQEKQVTESLNSISRYSRYY